MREISKREGGVRVCVSDKSGSSRVDQRGDGPVLDDDLGVWLQINWPPVLVPGNRMVCVWGET